jgi:hypothetical protein
VEFGSAKSAERLKKPESGTEVSMEKLISLKG